MANAHSHAFQIDLRGQAELPAPEAAGHDDFWTWRREMFTLADALDPDAMGGVGRRCYAEMLAAGYGVAGEFHYVHHRPDGSPHPDPNHMAKALGEAAATVGLRLVLLPAAYHRNGWEGADRPPGPGQRRFCDPSLAAFLDRVDDLRSWAAGVPGVSVGVAAHSLRAVPLCWVEGIARYADAHALPLHVHVAEQRRELDEVLAEHGASPIEVLDRAGALGPRTSLVHAIHVTPADVSTIAERGALVVTCPTTEGNLGDGYFPALAYRDAGVRMAIGTDSQAVLDPVAELRELEMGARRERRTRHALLAAEPDFWGAVRRAGLESLGLPDDLDVGALEVDIAAPALRGVSPEARVAALVAGGSAGLLRRRPQVAVGGTVPRGAGAGRSDD